jgi:hypothetical protein
MVTDPLQTPGHDEHAQAPLAQLQVRPERQHLLDRMADIVVAAGGRLYPAKDATMSGEAPIGTSC